MPSAGLKAPSTVRLLPWECAQTAIASPWESKATYWLNEEADETAESGTEASQVDTAPAGDTTSKANAHQLSAPKIARLTITPDTPRTITDQPI
jgi:hypothetical protein